MSVNALVAADHALLTTEAQYFSLQGVEQALQVVDLARDTLNPEPRLLGVVLNIANMRTKHARADPRGAARALRRQGLPHRHPAVDRATPESAERGGPDPRLPPRPRRGLPVARRRAAAALCSGRSCSPRSTSSPPSSYPRAQPGRDDGSARAARRARAVAGARRARGAGLRRRPRPRAGAPPGSRRPPGGLQPGAARGRLRRPGGDRRARRAWAARRRPDRAARASFTSSWAAPPRRRSAPTGSPRPTTRSPSRWASSPLGSRLESVAVALAARAVRAAGRSSAACSSPGRRWPTSPGCAARAAGGPSATASTSSETGWPALPRPRSSAAATSTRARCRRSACSASAATTSAG